MANRREQIKLLTKRLLAVLTITLSLLHAPGAVAANTVGKSCMKKNQLTTTKGVQLKCTQVGKKLIWQKFEPQTPNKTSDSVPQVIPTPIPTPTIAKPLDDGYPENIPAPNRSCPSNGDKAMLYGGSLTCINNKWILDPGSVIGPPNSVPNNPAPTQSNNSSSNPTPTPQTSINRNRPSVKIALEAFTDVKQILEKAPNPTNSFILRVSPQADKDLAAIATRVMPASVKFWQSVYAPKKPAEILLSSWSEKEWMVNAAREAGDTDNGYGGMAAWFDNKPKSAWESELGSGMHTGKMVDGVAPKIDIVVSGPDAKNRPGGTTTWPHEYVHNVQSELMPSRMYEAPCWFIEGMAQFYGLALAYPDSTDYLLDRDSLLKDQEFGNYPFTAQKSATFWRDSLVKNEKPNCGLSGGYWIGQIAIEQMVERKGTSGIISLMRTYESTGDFNKSFLGVYGYQLSEFYADSGMNLYDVVEGLLGRSVVPQNKDIPDAITISKQILAMVETANSAARSTETSSLIRIKIEPGAMNSLQEKWVRDAIQFINFLSPPVTGGEWDLVFPQTMPWFFANWDISKEAQRYKDMFATNTADQLVGSVHSYGQGNGGWAASFFVSPTKDWFNPDWQMRFIAQLLKPAGYSNVQYGKDFPEWYSRTFAYPIGAAYSEITSTGDYLSLRNGWIALLKTLPANATLKQFESPSAYTGPESEKSPGALAIEFLLSKSSLTKATNFFKYTAEAGASWDKQLINTFGVRVSELDRLIEAYKQS